MKRIDKKKEELVVANLKLNILMAWAEELKDRMEDLKYTDPQERAKQWYLRHNKKLIKTI